MSHRRVHSQGSVPFSWEDSPGISKFTHKECPTEMELSAPILAPKPTPSLFHSDRDHGDHKKIPPPPSQQFQPWLRSFSKIGLWHQDDPFVAALKECTKSSGGSCGKMATEGKISGLASKVRKGMSIFSCKGGSSSDAEDGNLMRLSNLPPLPRDRHRRLMLIKR